MRKICKIINIVLIFMIIGVFLWSEVGYALRPPLFFSSEEERTPKEYVYSSIEEDSFVPDSSESLELRSSIRHDMGNIIWAMAWVLYSKEEPNVIYRETL
jgi:hypothetical protein